MGDASSPGQPPPPPAVSPDGRFWWDGRAWQPIAPVTAPAVSSKAFCRACGASVDARAAVCLSCGVALVPSSPIGTVAAWPTSMAEPKSAGLAMLFTIFVPGTGHLYIGNNTKGTPHVIANAIGFLLACTLILIPISLVIWIATLCMTVGSINSETERYNMSRFGRPS